MKRTVIVLVSMGVLGVWCTSKKSAQRSDSRSSLVVSPQDIHSQSPNYNGGRLEQFEHFDSAEPDLAKLKPGQQATVKAYRNANDSSPAKLTVMFLRHDELAGDMKPELANQIDVFQVFDTSDGSYRDLCGGTKYEAPYGPKESHEQNALDALQGKALLVKGHWDHTKGTYSPPDSSAGAFTFSCVNGIVGKCAHWGYIPGIEYPGPSGKESLTPYHEACVYAGRAEYHLGKSYTCDSTNFDVYDRLNIKSPQTGSGMGFEAAWTSEGIAALDSDPSKSYLRQARYSECDTAPELKFCVPDDRTCDDPARKWKDSGWRPEILISESTNPSEHHTKSGKCPSVPNACER
jgi:ADYC domain